MEALYTHYGTEALIRLRDNVSRMCVVSLFSGLGGAELAKQNIFVAVSTLCKETGLEPPTQPRYSASFVVDIELIYTSSIWFQV